MNRYGMIEMLNYLNCVVTFQGLTSIQHKRYDHFVSVMAINWLYRQIVQGKSVGNEEIVHRDVQPFMQLWSSLNSLLHPRLDPGYLPKCSLRQIRTPFRSQCKVVKPIC